MTAMRWRTGIDDTEAECEDCDIEIDPSIRSLCDSCGGHFCDDHLVSTRSGQLCESCARRRHRSGGRYWDSPRAPARRGFATVLYAGGSVGAIGLTVGGAFWAGVTLIVGVGAVLVKMARHDLQIENAERKAGL